MKRGTTYEDRVYAMLQRRGWSEKFEHPGIYCICINDRIVYIGKSDNMLRRMSQHYVGIKRGSERKYRVLAEAKNKGYIVHPDVLYYAKSKRKNTLEDELGRKEGELIRAYMPALNTQIPKEENWRSYSMNKKAQSITLDELLQELNL